MAITQDGGAANASGSLSVDEETDLALLVSTPPSQAQVDPADLPSGPALDQDKRPQPAHEE